MVGPMGTSLVGGAAHADKRLLDSLDDSNGLVVFSGGRGEVDAGLVHDDTAERGGEVGTVVGDDAPRSSVAAHDVFHE